MNERRGNKEYTAMMKGPRVPRTMLEMGIVHGTTRTEGGGRGGVF